MRARLAWPWRIGGAAAFVVALAVLGYAIAFTLAPTHRLRAEPIHGSNGTSPRSTVPYRASGPSIVFILTDDQRWDTLWAMPTVRRELIGRGIDFTNGFVVNSLCCPSRSSILTGQYSHSTGVYSDAGRYGGFPAFRDSSTVATWLRAAGYHTALMGKYLNEYAGKYIPPGWDRWFAYEQPPGYFNYRMNDQGIIRRFGGAPGDYSTDVLATRAVSFIRQTSGPLFLYFAPFAPHYPATRPPRYARAFGKLRPFRPPNYNEANVSDKPQYVRAERRLTRADMALIDAIRRDQYRTLLAVDDAVKGILNALRDTHRLRNTMIVFLSDNGLTWGEHRFGIVKEVPYEESIRVPFVVRDDQLIRRPRSDAHMVLNIDLAPTFAALARVFAPRVEGRSLLPLLANPRSPWRSAFLAEHLHSRGNPPTFCAVRTNRFIYIAYGTGERELYDLRRDPYELSNRAGDRRYSSLLAALRRRLLQLCQPPPPGYTPG